MESCSVGEEKEVTINDKLLRPPNIYLVGAQCTGKTTLLEALRTHFVDAKDRDFHDHPTHLPAVIEEVVRGVMRRKGFTVTDIHNPTGVLSSSEAISRRNWMPKEPLQIDGSYPIDPDSTQ